MSVEMYNQFIKNAITLVAMTVVFTLAACSDSRENNIEVGEQESKAGIGLPKNLQSTALPTNGQLKAYFIVDNNPRMEMQFDGAQAQITIANLDSGTHRFRIEYEFEYTDSAQAPLILATAETRLNLVPGTNNLDFDGVYQYPDSDGDSIENFAELEKGTDPMDSTCLFGQIWNGCTPAETPVPNPA
jgi:hypothetical protein